MQNIKVDMQIMIISLMALMGCLSQFLHTSRGSVQRPYWPWGLALCFAVLLLVLQPGLSHADDKQERQTVLAKGSDSYVPYSFLNDDGEVDGFNNELFRAVAKVAGFDAQLIAEPWPKIRDEFEAGEIDVITGMYYSPERAKVVNFSLPTITVKYSIFVREQEQRINALSDLTGKDVIVMRGSIAHDLLKQQNFRGNLILTNDTMASLRMLAEGKHDAALLVRLQGLHLLNQFKLENIKAVGEPFAPRKFSFAVNKNAPELLFRINEALVVLKATGEYDRIYDKWFGILTDQGMSYENIVRYSVMMAAAVGSLFLLMAAWLQILRRQVRSRTLLLENAYDDLETRVEERTHDLGERVKELTGLYALSNIFNHENRSISEILQAITEVLPPAWHYPDITSAQITYGDQAFTSSNFQETSWCQNCDIVVSNETVGAVNIYYREQMPELFEGPFLEEERNLIDDIAHRIGEYIERNKTEDDLINEQEYSALQRKFVALVSHEFRTPLSIIDGIAQRMVRCKRQITPDVLREKSEKIRSAVERMTDLIENTLYAARLEENKIELTPVPINPGNMIREICSLHSDISSEHDIRADITGLPSTISADEKLLSIVFNNLLSNAIKFAPKSPLIEVKGWTDDKHAVVRVSDHGVGIPKEDLPVMFERFFRAKTAEGIKGTGIGLTISKEIIEMHGGTIEVDSIEGEGSTFTVRLPIDGERQLY